MPSFRILVVDDERDIREVAELSLGLDRGFRVRSCASGEDALAASFDWSPDIVLCDVIMRDMEGPAILARLREATQTANIPVVFLTARARKGELDRLSSRLALLG